MGKSNESGYFAIFFAFFRRIYLAQKSNRQEADTLPNTLVKSAVIPGRRLTARARRNVTGWLFVTPLLAFFGMFYIYPMIDALVTSFQGFDYTSYYFVGWENYQTIFNDKLFWMSLLNTTIFVLLVVVPGTILALLMSLCINSFRSGASRAFFKAAFYIPGITSVVSLAMVWQYLFDNSFGLGNFLLKALGFQPVNFLGGNLVYASMSLILISTSLGSWIVVMTAGLNGISKELYEAAMIDGANGRQSFFKITLPLLKPTLLYVIVTATVGAFQIFAILLLMTGGGPAYKTTTILMLIYREAFMNMNIGRACAEGIILCIIVCSIAVIQFKCLGGDDVEY